MIMTKIYLSGPMQGHPNFNHELFDHVTEYLRSIGHEVFSSAEWARQNSDPKIFICPKGDAKKARRTGFDLPRALVAYANYISYEADIILMLPNWEPSKGCRYEHALAVALDLPIGYWESWCVGSIGVPRQFLTDEVFETKKEPIWN